MDSYNKLKDENFINVSDIDFSIANQIIKFLLHHLETVFDFLPKVSKIPKSYKKREIQLYDELDIEFTYNQLLEVSERLSIPKSTAYAYRTKFLKDRLIEHLEQGGYRKIF